MSDREEERGVRKDTRVRSITVTQDNDSLASRTHKESQVNRSVLAGQI